ncbi:MAG: DsbA family protein [Alphaproteobacteria bacterium]|nr:DsbA family protein [Alphaproteobacteria bacterium]
MLRLHALAGAAGLAFLLAAQPATAQDQAAGGLTPEEAASVREIVRELLRSQPEIVIEAIREFQARQEAQERELRRQAISELGTELRADPDSPSYGNEQGDVVIVEFFDYRCGFCRRMTDAIFEVVDADARVRWVFKEFPVLGAESELAARAALAARNQGKYVEFHRVLMSGPASFNEAILAQLARSVGMDPLQLRKDMEDPAIDEALRRNLQIAEQIGIRGTPAFVINDQFYGGAMSAENLVQAIQLARVEAAQSAKSN